MHRCRKCHSPVPCPCFRLGTGLAFKLARAAPYFLPGTPLREVAILGLPSSKWGEEVTAVVVRHDGATLAAEELIAFGKRHLAAYKVPKAVIFIPYPEMPINYSGKILKRELRQRLMADRSN